MHVGTYRLTGQRIERRKLCGKKQKEKIVRAEAGRTDVSKYRTPQKEERHELSR